MSAYLPILIPALVKILLVIAVVMTGVAYTTLAERKVSAWMQDRKGPNRVGPFGLLQPVADGIKFFFKEDITPTQAYRPAYLLAPLLCFVPALVAFAAIPFGTSITVAGKSYEMWIAPGFDIGVLYLLSLSSLGVYGIILGGWSSANKYSILGSLRAASQVISYELGVGLSILPVIIWTGSFSILDIVNAQKESGVWFVVPHCLGFVVFLVSMFAETNRMPFDLPEGESEIVGGYHTEYSGLRFAMFFMGEYANLITASALIVCFYFGGWNLPFLEWANFGPVLGGVLAALTFAAKVAFFLFFFIWVRWTVPRFRYDQLMDLGWKRLFPIAVLNLFVMTTLMVFAGWGTRP